MLIVEYKAIQAIGFFKCWIVLDLQYRGVAGNSIDGFETFLKDEM